MERESGGQGEGDGEGGGRAGGTGEVSTTGRLTVGRHEGMHMTTLHAATPKPQRGTAALQLAVNSDKFTYTEALVRLIA